MKRNKTNGRFITRYTDEMIEWLKVNFFIKNNKELAKDFESKFGISMNTDTLRCYCSKKLGLRKGHQRNAGTYNSIYTKEMCDWLIDNINKTDSRKELTDKFNAQFNMNVSVNGIIQKCFVLGARYDKKHCDNLLKQNTIKAKLLADLKKPIGSELESKGYTFIKLGNCKYVLKQRYLYEKAYGKIPNGCYVVFLDGNKKNFDLKNLACVSMNQRMNYNRLSVESEPEYNKQLLEFLEINNEIKEIINKQKR